MNLQTMKTVHQVIDEVLVQRHLTKNFLRYSKREDTLYRIQAPSDAQSRCLEVIFGDLRQRFQLSDAQLAHQLSLYLNR